MAKQIGRFVDKRISSGCQYDRDLAAARAAMVPTAGIGHAITREEGLRRLSDPDQLASLRTHNVMSPDAIGFRAMAGNGNGPTVVEVSAGEFMGEALYGITVYHVEPGDRSRDWDASKAVSSLDELLQALQALNGGEA